MQSADIIEYSLELSSLKKRSVTYPKYLVQGVLLHGGLKIKNLQVFFHSITEENLQTQQACASHMGVRRPV